MTSFIHTKRILNKPWYLKVMKISDYNLKLQTLLISLSLSLISLLLCSQFFVQYDFVWLVLPSAGHWSPFKSEQNCFFFIKNDKQYSNHHRHKSQGWNLKKCVMENWHFLKMANSCLIYLMNILNKKIIITISMNRGQKGLLFQKDVFWVMKNWFCLLSQLFDIL